MNARVYAAADKYEIPELRDLAHQKFASRLYLRMWPYYEIHKIVFEVIRSTPHNVNVIRKTVLELCATYVEDIMGVRHCDGVYAQDWVLVLKEDPDFLLKVLELATSDNKRRLTNADESRKETVADLQAQIENSKNALLITEARAQDWKAKHDNIKASHDSHTMLIQKSVEKGGTITCSDCPCATKPLFKQNVPRQRRIFSLTSPLSTGMHRRYVYKCAT